MFVTIDGSQREVCASGLGEKPSESQIAQAILDIGENVGPLPIPKWEDRPTLATLERVMEVANTLHSRKTPLGAYLVAAERLGRPVREHNGMFSIPGYIPCEHVREVETRQEAQRRFEEELPLGKWDD